MSRQQHGKTGTRWPLGLVVLLLIVGLWSAALLPAHGGGPLPLLGAATLALLLLAGIAQARMARLAALRRQEQRASAARSRTLAHLSQDLRAPLNGILAYADVLAIELEGTRQAGFVGAARACGMRLLGQVEALLELSALEAGEVRLVLRSEALAALLASALRSQRAANAMAPAELDCAADLPAHLLCDKARLLRVLELLLAHATDGANTVRLAATLEQDGLRLRIAGSEPAPPAAGRWHTLDLASAAGGGAGAELAIAARLLELMGGHLWIDGSPGRPAAFTVALPCPDTARAVLEPSA